MKKPVFILIGVGLIFAAIGAYFSLERLAPSASTASASRILFSQTMPDAQGQQQPLSQWRGKTLVVNFWATWCAPCVEEMPELVALQRELQGQNVQIIGIGIDSASNISEFSTKHNIDYPLYVSGMTGTELSKQFGNKAGGLPFTVLIRADGKVETTYLGRLKMEDLRRDILSIQAS